MRKFSFLLLIPILFACNGSNEETVDLEEIMPTAEYDKIERKDSIIEEVVFQPTIARSDIELVGIAWDSIAISEELSVPERFKPTRTEKFVYHTGGAAIEFNSWSFQDSVKSLKAFLNWMNCYGDRCSMIELKAPVNIQRNALLIMQSDTCIVQVQTAIGGVNELKKWKKLYTSNKTMKWNYIIIQPKGGKSSWTSYKNEEEVELKQLTNL